MVSKVRGVAKRLRSITASGQGLRRAAFPVVVAAALLIGVGAYVWAFSYGPMTSTQPELGTLSGGAATTVDVVASGGQSVKFGSSGGGGALVKPTAATVGPRIPVDTVISSSQALTTLRSTGYLSGVTIDGMLSLSGTDGVGWVIEDVRINSGSLYGLRAYRSGDPYAGTYEQRPVFRYIEVVGMGSRGTGQSCSAALFTANVVIEHANVYGCQDGAKVGSNTTLNYSWLHDLDHPSGAHCDTVQIVSGTNILLHGNRFDSYVGYSSDGSGGEGGRGSGALQTGSVTADIQATWTNNWFAGGHYTVRGESDATYNVDYVFHNNIFMRYGTSVALGLTDLIPYTYGSVYGDTSSYQDWVNNVWEDTGDPVN